MPNVTVRLSFINGSILAKIHRIEQKHDDFAGTGISIDWDSYINDATTKCPEIYNALKDNRKLLYEALEKGNLALKRVLNVAVISNGDMDIKNVLWVKDKPKIIDLECLKYGNPYIELFQLALHWSGYDNHNIDYNLLKTFLQAYINDCGEFYDDWEELYHCNFGMLEWLEYNIKRALMIECNNEDEMLLGIEQVHSTMKNILYYSSVKDRLIKMFNRAAL